MKKKNNIKLFSIRKAFADYQTNGSMISLGNSFELPGLFKALGWRLLSAAMPGRVKFAKRLIQLHNFAKYLLIMKKHHGASHVVSYLKACQLAVQKRIAGDRIESLRDLVPDLPLPRLTSSGLPRIIPLMDRRAICNGSSSVIRWWLTVFSVYRVISIPGKLKLETITAPFTGDLDYLGIVSQELKVLTLSNLDSFQKFKKPAKGILYLETASPTSISSWLGYLWDLYFLGKNGLIDDLQVMLNAFPKSPLHSFYTACSDLLKLKDDNGLPSILKYSKLGKDNYLSLGQLSCKLEAAGKVRVFAMVDIWTQSVLKPVHDMLFSYLRSLPNDGTFDQFSAIRLAQEKVKISKCSFGYDLSAATDRLPIALQAAIIETIFSKEVADSWVKLLVGRDYILHHEDYGDHSLRYEVGQPMGAYSSWGMLAVTHHYLVQLAARRAGQIRPGQWYDNYLLLGDDIIMFDKDVAHQYLLIMEGIGVPINLSKSVVATNSTIEFAKVTGHNGKNVSAISWKMFLSQNTMMGRVNIAFSLMGRDMFPTRPVSWVENIMRKSKYTIGEMNFSFVALLSMFSKSGVVPLEHLIKALYSKDKPDRKLYKNVLDNINLPYIRNIIGKLATNSKVTYSNSKLLKHFWNMDLTWFKRSLLLPILSFKKEIGQGWRDKAAKKLTMDMMKLILPTYPVEARPFLYKEDDALTEELNYVVRSLYDNIRMNMNPTLIEVLKNLPYERENNFTAPFSFNMGELKKWIESNNSVYSLDLPGLMDVESRIQQLREFVALPLRTQNKLDKKVISITKEESPLAIIRFTLKANKKRPADSYFKITNFKA